MNKQESINLLVKKLKEENIDEEMIESFILNNYEYLNDNIENVLDNMFFLFNSESLYAIVIMEKDRYLWSNTDDNNLDKLKDSSDDSLVGDFIIEEILRFGEDGKFDSIVSGLSNNYLDNVKLLKKLKFNSNGYYIK